jgi:hypothetical protein
MSGIGGDYCSIELNGKGCDENICIFTLVILSNSGDP